MKDNGVISFNEQILEQIMELGCRMLTAGGEVHRVEDTLVRLCRAYGASHTDVFTITSSIVVTVHFPQRPPMTQTCRVPAMRTDMDALTKLNTLSRDVCAHPCSAEVWRVKMSKIAPTRDCIPAQAAVWALVSTCFALFFGGTLVDGVCSALVGAVLLLLKSWLDRRLPNSYFVIVLCGMAGGALSMLPGLFIPDVSPFYINIGNIMLLIPGIALTTSIRDMFSGDTISGLMRFVEAFLISMVIAWSFALFSTETIPVADEQTAWAQLITALVGSLGFSWVFHNQARLGLPSAAGGPLCWAAVLLAQWSGISEYAGYALGAVLVALYAEYMARRERCPATVFLTVGTIPLIPGKSLYITMRYAMEGAWHSFLTQGMATLVYACSISAGILLVMVLWQAVSFRKQHPLIGKPLVKERSWQND